MTILVIADDEAVVARVPDIRADVVVSCGDLPDELILRAAARCRCTAVFAVKGNHDARAPFRTGITNLHLGVHTVGGLAFGGFEGCWTYKPRGNFLYSQDAVSDALAAFPAVDVFVAHNSPRLVHEQADGIHTGFTAFNDYLQRCAPRLFLHGHQHVNAQTAMGATRVICTLGYRYVGVG